MAKHEATIKWDRTSPEFLKGKYSREHLWIFDGGLSVPASASPSVVPAPFSNPANVDPEEAFVAAVASCHMLTFLWLAGRQGFQVDRYEDKAVGEMGANEQGTPWVRLITLYPKIIYGGARQPTTVEQEELHHLAHEQCFISNSIKTEIRIEVANEHGS